VYFRLPFIRFRQKTIFLRRIPFIFLAFFCFGQLLTGQSTDALIAYVPFNNGNSDDQSGEPTTAEINGTPIYACGLGGGSLEMDGDDFLILNGRVNDVFGTSPFTLSFYFKPTNFSVPQDIIGKRQACIDQKALAVVFLPASNSLDVIFSENSTKFTNFNIPLPNGNCWYHFAMVRNNRTTIVYMDGEEVERKNAVARIDIDNPESLAFANGPCRGATDERFEGFIDEFRVYDRALDRDGVRGLYVELDAVANPDTLLFLGGQVPLRIANTTCASSVQWYPSTGIADPTMPSTVYTPSAEGTFKIWAEFDDGSCIAADTFQVIVVDPANLDCGKIFLPNAFTPNDDGINDLYGIDNPFAIEKMNTLEVFDRLGNKVYTTTDVFSKWDGKFKSQLVSPGVYVYRVSFECKGEALSKMGSFTVLK